jgi:dTDP-4-amino-4,6-dideoxygalactose transaminase
MSKLAVLGGDPVRKTPYPHWPVHDERDIEAVTRVIKSGNWGGYPYPGPETRRFLAKFVELQGGGYPVAMANGTVTIEVACRASDIGWGDEVIVPALTFQATAAAPMAAGAIPIIVDVDPETYTIDPKAVQNAITDKTKAVIPVHLAAQMADMDAIMEIADTHDLIVIEDCAHAHGAKWRGKGAGTIGHFGSFSMQSSKILTSGEGGVLLCRSKKHAAKAAGIINCGRSHDPETMIEGGENYVMGANYRLSELACALAAVGIERFPEQASEREEMINYMEESLSEVPGIRLLKRDERHTKRSFYQFNFALVPEAFGAENREVAYALNKEGIPCDTGYEAMNNYSLYQPQLSKLPVPSAFPEYFKFEDMKLTEARRAAEHEAITLDEAIFRDGQKGVDDFIQALKKVKQNAEALRAAAKAYRSETG